MKSVYKSVSIFRRKHNRYPRSSMELLNDMAPNPGAYEFADRDAAVASLSNPDIIHQHPRWSKERIKNMTTYQMRFRRFDSSPFGSQKPEGTRDVLMWSSDYYFENIKNNYDNINASTMNPVGFYLVLWDDGQIERVPFDKTLQVPAESNSWQVGFAGQAGLTKGSKTFDEFHKNLINYRNWKRAQGKKSQ